MRGRLFIFHDPELFAVALILALLHRKVVYDCHENLPASMLQKFWLPLWVRWLLLPAVWVVEWLPARLFSRELLEASQCYSWPGNLSEVENFVKRYLMMGDDSVAQKELEPKLDSHNADVRHEQAVEYLSSSKIDFDTCEKGNSLKTLVRSIQGETAKNAITNALAKTHWNRKAAARLLRISYRGLLYKIQRYGLNPPTINQSLLIRER